MGTHQGPTPRGSHCPLLSPWQPGAWPVPSTPGAPEGQNSSPRARQGPSRKHPPQALASRLQDLKGMRVSGGTQVSRGRAWSGTEVGRRVTHTWVPQPMPSRLVPKEIRSRGAVEPLGEEGPPQALGPGQDGFSQMGPRVGLMPGSPRSWGDGGWGSHSSPGNPTSHPGRPRHPRPGLAPRARAWSKASGCCSCRRGRQPGRPLGHDHAGAAGVLAQREGQLEAGEAAL